MDAIKLVRYLHASRRRYLKALSELPWDEVIQDKGASFLSIRDIFLHALDVEDRLVNYVIPDKSEVWAQEDFSEFSNINRIEERVEEVEEEVETYLANLTENELYRKIKLPWRKDPPLSLSVEDVLVHVAIENISHMGELIALMWQFDKQPPFLGWSAFLEQRT